MYSIKHGGAVGIEDKGLSEDGRSVGGRGARGLLGWVIPDRHDVAAANFA
jgi:hypothetical protein